MTDVAKNTQPQWRQLVLVRLKWTWIFLTWYTLSIGPMYWTWFDGTQSRDPSYVEAFYRPLVYACALIPPLGKLVNAYIELWVL
ncbi:MAG: hypothetical protein V4719_18040 [Planctomycetota bacterium]